MKLNKRVIFALTLLIVLSWGINMSQKGLALPGFTLYSLEGAKGGEGSP